MISTSKPLTQSFKIFITGLFICLLFANTGVAQQSQPPFSLDLNLGGGLIGHPDVKTVVQPELGLRFQPGKWGVALESSFFTFDPSYSAEQYRSGFEEYTEVQKTADKWNAFNINAGPRFRFGQQLPVQFSIGLDLALSYKNPPAQSVEFNDPEANFDGVELTIANFEPENSYSKWSAAIRPQLQLEINPFRSNRIGFHLKTGIQQELSNREFTYTERDLSGVQQVPSAREMFFQFENAPEMERTVSAPKTNFFANAGIKIRFGESKAPAQDYNAARSNKPTSRAGDIGDGDLDSDGDGIDDGTEKAQDYNSSRSNKPRTERGDDCDGEYCGRTDHFVRPDPDTDDEILLEAIRMARIINPLGIIISAGQVLTRSDQNPGHIEAATEAESPLYEALANDGDSDNNNNEDPAPVNRYDLQPVSYCVSLSIVPNQVLKTFFESGDKPAAPQYDGDSQIAEDESLYRWGNNELRVCHIEEILTQEEFADLIDSYIHRVEDGIYFHVDGSKENVYCWGNNELRECPGEKTKTQSQFGNLIDSMVHRLDNGGDSGGTITVDLPEMMKSASFSISKRSARTERNGMNDGDLDGDGYGDVDGLHFELEIDPLDEDSDDDGLMDAIESATYSISKRSARTGRSTSGDEGTDTQMASDDDPCGPGVWARTTGGNENCSPENSGQENPLAQESGWQETPVLDVATPSDVYQWTYKLNDLSGGEELPGNGTLTVLFTGGNWHFDVQLDPDDDGDGFGDLIQNSSFSISKR